MKETYYFPHDYNATQDPKIITLLVECGLCGVGLYWIIIEILHQQPEGRITEDEFVKYLQFYTKGENEQVLNKIQKVLNTTNLLLKKDGFVYSERVIKNKKYRQDITLKRSLAGKKSAEIRHKTTSVEQVLNKCATKGQQGKERKGKENNKDICPFFLEFWEYYPRREGKKAALIAWNKLNPSEELQLKMVEALRIQKKSEAWTKEKGKYIPYPATWLNGERWNDEVISEPTTTPIAEYANLSFKKNITTGDENDKQ